MLTKGDEVVSLYSAYNKMFINTAMKYDIEIMDRIKRGDVFKCKDGPFATMFTNARKAKEIINCLQNTREVIKLSKKVK